MYIETSPHTQLAVGYAQKQNEHSRVAILVLVECCTSVYIIPHHCCTYNNQVSLLLLLYTYFCSGYNSGCRNKEL